VLKDSSIAEGTSNVQFAAQQWGHLMVAVTSTDATVYKNGVSEQTVTGLTLENSIVDCHTELFVGIEWCFRSW